MTSAIEQYKQVNAHKNVGDASAHRLIQMLLEGALEKVALAKGQIRQKNIAEKGKNISLAITIVDGLCSSLDKEKGGEIAENLDKLYHYIMDILLFANLENSISHLDEATELLTTIKSGWDGIEEEAQEIMEKGGPDASP